MLSDSHEEGVDYLTSMGLTVRIIVSSHTRELLPSQCSLGPPWLILLFNLQKVEFKKSRNNHILIKHNMFYVYDHVMFMLIRIERKKNDHQSMLTFVLLSLCLQFVWPISFNWQLNFPFRINMQCRYAILYCCEVHTEIVLFHVKNTQVFVCFRVAACGCSETSTSVFCLVKNLFLRRVWSTQKYKGTHAHTLTHTLQEAAKCPTGWLLFWEVVRYLTCWLRKAFPLGLNI